MIAELLHTWALAPAAVGTCCLAADWASARVPELAASVLMLFAMLDLSLGSRVPPVYWAAVLILVAMTLAVWRGARRRVRPHRAAFRRTMPTHAPLGLIAMAVLAVAMIPHGALAVGEPRHHSGGDVTALLVGASLAYSAASLLLLRERLPLLRRLEVIAMSVTIGMMCAAAALP